jgi:hypothetical protein
MAAQADTTRRDLAHLNARFKDIQMLDALQRGRQVAQDVARNARNVTGQQVAGLAGAGVSLDSGTGLAIQEETGFFSGLDIQRALNNAAREAWGLRVSGKLRRLEANLAFDAAQGNQSSSNLFGPGNGMSTGTGQNS